MLTVFLLPIFGSEFLSFQRKNSIKIIDEFISFIETFYQFIQGLVVAILQQKCAVIANLNVLFNSGLLENLILIKEENEVGVGGLGNEFLYLENMMVVFICSLVIGKGAKHAKK